MSAAALISEILLAPHESDESTVEFRDITASAHACFLHFENGHATGQHLVTGDYLLPDEGLIMSSGAVRHARRVVRYGGAVLPF